MEPLNTVFKNSSGREYDVRISVSIAHDFCRENKIKLEGLNPLLLDISQLLDLAYMGTRSSKMQALGETKDEFLDGLEGPAFSEAQDCAVNALVNFSLKTLPKNQAAALKAEIQKLQDIQKQLQPEGSAEGQQKGEGESGGGATFSESAAPAELTQPEQG